MAIKLSYLIIVLIQLLLCSLKKVIHQNLGSNSLHMNDLAIGSSGHFCVVVTTWLNGSIESCYNNNNNIFLIRKDR